MQCLEHIIPAEVLQQHYGELAKGFVALQAGMRALKTTTTICFMTRSSSKARNTFILIEELRMYESPVLMLT